MNKCKAYGQLIALLALLNLYKIHNRLKTQCSVTCIRSSFQKCIIIMTKVTYFLPELLIKVQNFMIFFSILGVFKKLIAVSKKRDCSQIADWAHSISNHMYWAASSSNGNGEMVLQKWQSILNHVCNKHEGQTD